MRLFFATDVHGSEQCFRKFLAAKAFYSADVLILGGDISGKAILPIVRRSNGFDATLFDKLHVLKSEKDAIAFQARAEMIGFYTIRVDQDELSRLRNDPHHLRACEMGLMRERLERWIAMADEELDSSDRIYFCPGNDDDPELDTVVRNGGKIAWIDGRSTSLGDGLAIAGLGGSNPTPWNTPREYSESELRTRLDAIAEPACGFARTVWSIHVPPYDCSLDLCPELNSSLQIRVGPGAVPKKPVGSTAVRSFLERRQPLLGLFGHVHEARGNIHLGTTVCVNPGSTYQEGTLSGALITLEVGKVRDVQFTCG